MTCSPVNGVTTHPGQDSQPRFSPDGKRIAFTSDRTGMQQVYVSDVAGGLATQITFHSEGASVEDWYPDGQSLLIRGVRDQSFVEAQRLFRVNVTKRSGEELLFDAAAGNATISPDGKKILFFARGAWPGGRQGYRGSKASQVWQYDTPTGKFTELVHNDRGGRYPLWQGDAKAFYYVGRANRCSLQSLESRFVAAPREGTPGDEFYGRLGRHAVHFPRWHNDRIPASVRSLPLSARLK